MSLDDSFRNGEIRDPRGVRLDNSTRVAILA